MRDFLNTLSQQNLNKKNVTEEKKEQKNYMQKLYTYKNLKDIDFKTLTKKIIEDVVLNRNSTRGVIFVFYITRVIQLVVIIRVGSSTAKAIMM